MKESIVDYIFVDGETLRKYFEQVPKSHPKDRMKSMKLSLALTGPKIEVSRESVDRDPTAHEMIQRLIQYLRSSDLLDDHRPVALDPWVIPPLQAGKAFFLEAMHARKVIIPRTLLKDVRGLNDFAVWVSDPNPEDLSEEEYRGTFVYLTETYWDHGPFEYVHSGCSALQAIANSIRGEELLKEDPSRALGDRSDRHPIAKLEELGAVPGETRRIVSLYRKRYFCNEQRYVYGERSYRVNDLLGYPIFIAAALDE